MRFGFDIDDTLINLREHAFHIYNRKLNQQVDVEKFHSLEGLEIHSLFGLDQLQGQAMWIDSMEEIYFTDCPSFDAALDTLHALAKEGHEIYYITSRPKHFCGQTREWMKAQGYPIVDNHFYCGMGDHEKVEIIENLKLDYYVDDKPVVLETLHASNTTVIVKNQSYNQHIALPRLHDWSQFTQMITK